MNPEILTQPHASPASSAGPGKSAPKLIEDPDVADYTRPRNFVGEAKLRAEAEAIVLPNDLKECLALWRWVVKMPADNYTQKARRRIFKQRVGNHLFRLQQGSPVIHTGDAMCPKVATPSAPATEEQPASVDVHTDENTIAEPYTNRVESEFVSQSPRQDSSKSKPVEWIRNLFRFTN